MYLKPAAGLAVPDPARGDVLPPEGRDVEATQYWQRRLNDGDVSQSSAESTQAKKKES
ncbi:MAG: DUF2635 domain-containing protein [Aquabacterium sp.]|nr:DUF2635 domain-containing protein [Aquabacterium sp.]